MRGPPRALSDPVQAPAAPPLLTIHGVSKSYALRGRRLPVLQAIDLSLQPSRFAAVVGPSGSGKSTLLNLIAGLEEPDTGTIMLAGSPQRLGRIGFMPQRDLLHPWRNALDNATVALEIQGMRRREARDRARDLFGRFGLGGFEDARPQQLSGGMRQRVALARTVLAGGDLILLDEPFGALDALTRAQMQDWLLETWPSLQRAGVLVTHDVEEALLLADEVYVLSARPGRVVVRVEVPFRRPRRRGLVADPRFVRLKLALLDALGLAPLCGATGAEQAL
jgi:ABC-type nitrate/sulfonate/bicarbonate transport system ATPase subunit